MLKMAGIQTHPALRILIGVALIALGIARHRATVPLIIGGVLIVWGIAAVLDLTRSGRDQPRSGKQRAR
jgi:hypothetical protein